MSILKHFRNPWEAATEVLKTSVLDSKVLDSKVLETGVLEGSVLEEFSPQDEEVKTGKLYIYPHPKSSRDAFTDIKEKDEKITSETINKICYYAKEIFLKNGIDFIEPTYDDKKVFAHKTDKKCAPIRVYDSLVGITDGTFSKASAFEVGSAAGVCSSFLISNYDYYCPYVSRRAAKRLVEETGNKLNLNSTTHQDALHYYTALFVCHEAWHQYLSKVGFYWKDSEYAFCDSNDGHFGSEVNLMLSGTSMKLHKEDFPTVNDALNLHKRTFPLRIEMLPSFQRIAVKGYFDNFRKIGNYVRLPHESYDSGGYQQFLTEWERKWNFDKKRELHFLKDFEETCMKELGSEYLPGSYSIGSPKYPAAFLQYLEDQNKK